LNSNNFYDIITLVKIKQKRSKMHEQKITDVDWDLQSSIRIKIFAINSQKQILLGISNGGCQLPGGHLEKGESYKDTLIREFREETGIELNLDFTPEPFFEVVYKNHEKCSRVLYFLIHTDEKPNLQNTNYTQGELKAHFTLEYVDLDNFKTHVENNIRTTNLEINKVIDGEILEAFKHIPL